MELHVIGKPVFKSSKSTQTVVVSYNANVDCTVINCNLDIVTLGIAVNVLMREYNEALSMLQPDIATQIEETTRKVVLLNEGDRGQNTEPVRD